MTEIRSRIASFCDRFRLRVPILLAPMAGACPPSLSIAVAKINTEGNRVADVFYVTETGGTKIDPGPRTQEVRARLLRVLEDLAKQGKSG